MKNFEQELCITKNSFTRKDNTLKALHILLILKYVWKKLIVWSSSLHVSTIITRSSLGMRSFSLASSTVDTLYLIWATSLRTDSAHGNFAAQASWKARLAL